MAIYYNDGEIIKRGRQNMKRYLSVFLALALVLGTVLVPGGASAAVVY